MRKNQDSPKGWNVQVTKCRIDNNTYWWIPVARIGFSILPMGKVNRVNKGEAFLSKGRGTMKGNHRGSCSENGEKVKMVRGLRED